MEEQLLEMMKMLKERQEMEALHGSSDFEEVLSQRRKLLRCARCQAHGRDTKLQRCTGCEQMYYCSAACQSEDWASHKSRCREIRKTNQTTETLIVSNPHGYVVHREFGAFTQLANVEHEEAFRYALRLGHSDALHKTHVPLVRYVYDPAGKTIRQRFTLGEGSQGEVLPIEDIIDRIIEANCTASRTEYRQKFSHSFLREVTKNRNPNSPTRGPFGAMYEVVFKSDVEKWGVGHSHAEVISTMTASYNIDTSEQWSLMSVPPRTTDWMKMLRFTNQRSADVVKSMRLNFECQFGSIALGSTDTFKSYYLANIRRQIAGLVPKPPQTTNAELQERAEAISSLLDAFKPELAAWQEAARKRQVQQRKKEKKRDKAEQAELWALRGETDSTEPPYLTLEQRDQLYQFFNLRFHPDKAAVSKEIQYTDTGFCKVGPGGIHLEFTSIYPPLAYKLYHKYKDQLPPPRKEQPVRPESPHRFQSTTTGTKHGWTSLRRR